MSHHDKRSVTLAMTMAMRGQIVDVPHPDEPGVRVVGFQYLEAQASMVEAINAFRHLHAVWKLLGDDQELLERAVAKAAGDSQ